MLGEFNAHLGVQGDWRGVDDWFSVFMMYYTNDLNTSDHVPLTVIFTIIHVYSVPPSIVHHQHQDVRVYP